MNNLVSNLSFENGNYAYAILQDTLSVWDISSGQVPELKNTIYSETDPYLDDVYLMKGITYTQ